MKRLTVRLTLLSLVVALGLIAIAQAQRTLSKPITPSDANAAAASTTPDGELPALADAASDPKSESKDLVSRALTGTPLMPKAPQPLSPPISPPAPPSLSRAGGDPFAKSRLMDDVAGPGAENAPPSRYPAVEAAAAKSDSPAAAAEDANPLRRPAPPNAAPAPRLLKDQYVAPVAHEEPAEVQPSVASKAAATAAAARRDPFGRAPLKAPGDQLKAPGDPHKAPGDGPKPATPLDRYSQSDARDAGAAAAPRKLADPSALAIDDRYTQRNAKATEESTSVLAGRANDAAMPGQPPAELPRDDSPRALSPSGSRRPGLSGSALGAGAAAGIGSAIGSRSATPLDPAAARPGSHQLDGLQAPQVTIQKVAPPEIQVGKPATFQIIVRNTGTIPARDVLVRDAVPEGTSLIATTPPAANDEGQIRWQLGTLAAGVEKTLTLKVMPQAEGEIGSVATVSFQAEASARSTSTKPELVIEVSGPKKVMIGETATLSIRIANPGTGVASGVILHQTLPPQLKHASGSELEFEVGDLRPKESRQVDLTVTTVGAGQVINQITARGEGTLAAAAKEEFEVLSPALELTLTGPKRRFLERQASYTVSIANPGTAAAKDVELVSHLPKGMKFVSANNSGRYDQQTHSVYWSLAELPQGESGSVKLVTMPVEAGEQNLIIEGHASQNITQKHEEKINVDSVADVMFDVAQASNPIEVGGETTYEIRVINQGTKAADNIRLVAIIPRELKALSADGPTPGTVEGDRVVFEPLSRLAPKVDTTYRIRVQAATAGDHRVRIQLQTDDMNAPVTKEESTRVYADR
ncbi:MAG: DUF11 domain-containing protein [Planctomycetia bacterium]|nr:DUF11 domain-containing protein [Planctomycetia bacterium]